MHAQASTKRELLLELKSCRSLQQVQLIHAKVDMLGMRTDNYVANTLIRMYAKRGCMRSAQNVFDQVRRHDVVSWNVLIQGYAENGDGGTAVQLLKRMSFTGVLPDERTFLAGLKAWAMLAAAADGAADAALQGGRLLHLQAAQSGCLDEFVGSMLVELYGRCGCMHLARQAFEELQVRDVVSWTALVLGYAENGEEEEALEMFARMGSEGCHRNSLSFVAALTACCGLVEKRNPGSLKQLEELHRATLDAGCSTDPYVASSLIAAYGKCGLTPEALEVLQSVNARRSNTACWNAMLFAYAENGESDKALHLFWSMDCPRDARSFVAALKACSTLAAIEAGRLIHRQAEAQQLANNGFIAAALIDLYGKCGSMAEAEAAFAAAGAMHHDAVLWNALLTGHSRQGGAGQVFDLFDRMRDAGVQPDGVTLLAVLTACSHAGLVERGLQLYLSMERSYGVAVGSEHYICVLDMLNRCSQLNAAAEMLTMST